jgi:predicted nucleic acid-binding protein
MTPPYLFDSHALLAFFQNEEGAEIVAEILHRAVKKGLDRLLCVINLGEIMYVTKRRFGDSKKLEVLARVHQLGLQVLAVPQNLVFKAAEIRAQYPLSYVDCFALACAMEHSARVVTGNPDFKTIAHLVSIDWIR